MGWQQCLRTLASEFANSFDELSMILFHSFKKVELYLNKGASDCVGFRRKTSLYVGSRRIFFSVFFVLFCLFSIFCDFFGWFLVFFFPVFCFCSSGFENLWLLTACLVLIIGLVLFWARQLWNAPSAETCAIHEGCRRPPLF